MTLRNAGKKINYRFFIHHTYCLEKRLFLKILTNKIDISQKEYSGLIGI